VVVGVAFVGYEVDLLEGGGRLDGGRGWVGLL